MRGDEVLLKVEKVVNGGYGLGKVEGKVILVEGAYPGEEVIARITRDKKDFAFARAIRVVKGIPQRVAPKCRYFGKCGGCQFMDVSYETQLILKREMVRDSLQRTIGEVEVEDTEPSDSALGYRTKIELTAVSEGGEVRLGMKMRYSHRVVPIDRCEIAPDKANRVLRALPKILTALEVPVYDFSRKRGVLKHVVIRHTFSTEQTMVIFVTKTESFRWGGEISRLLLRELPWITSIVHVMNSKDSVVLRGPYRTLRGEGVITEEFDWETFQIPPTAFFQSNYYVASKLMNAVFEELELSGRETVLDLYSGVGLFSLRVSSAARRVIGVESSRVAVRAAKANANINDRRNVEFVEADVEEFIRAFEGKVDAVILDPPRGGAGKSVMSDIVRLKPPKVIYVSCEPSTLARDLKVLIQGGYEIKRIKPFDMFPQTFHVETMVVLERRG